MTDRELLELIAAQVGKLTSEFDNQTKVLDNLKTTVDGLSDNFTEIKEGQDRIENKIDDIEVNNANRHLSFTRELNDMKRSISRVEINTADNWKDIARLKNARKIR